MGIPMLKIRRSHDRLIFSHGDPYTGKTTSLYWDSPLVSRLSYPHNGNPYSWKDGLILKQDPCIWSLHQHCHNRNLYIEIITRHYIVSIPQHTRGDHICGAIEMCDYSLHGCDEAGNRHNFISHRHGERKTELCPRVWWYYGDVCKHGRTVQGQERWKGSNLHIQI